MAAYSLDTLLRRWALNQLTTEQAIGQVLQILNDLEPRVKSLERALASPPLLPAPPVHPEPPAAVAPPPRKRASRRKKVP